MRSTGQKLLLAIALCFMALGRGSSAQESVAEADLKAAFLYNFTKFVDWPTTVSGGTDAPFVLGIFGEDTFRAELAKALGDKKAHGRSIIVRQLSRNDEALGCQMVFFREAETKRMAQLGDSLKNRSVLTVGESEQFLEFGGILQLFFEDKQLRFQVSTGNAESSGLTISSKLLRLAKRVKHGGGR